MSAVHWCYRLHVWLGTCAGLVLLLLCFSGCLALFRMELSLWLQTAPAVVSNCELNADQAFQQLQHQLSGAPVRRLSLPALTGDYFELRLTNGKRAMVNACGSLLTGNPSAIGDFLVNLHTRLFMGKQGRWLVGAFGLLMLISTLTGVIAHRQLFKQFFKSLLQLRRGRHPRRWVSDAHKLLGIWLIPFHLLTAATGAWLGFYTLIYNPVTIKGAQAAAAIAYTQPNALSTLLASAQTHLPGLEPVFIDFFPERGHISIRGNLPGELIQRYSAEVLMDGQGQLLGVYDPRQLTISDWFAQSIMPLHMGDWLGVELRIFYGVMGLGTSLMIAMGLWLWANRRLHSSGKLLGAGTTSARLIYSLGIGLLCAAVLPLLIPRVNPGAAMFLICFGIFSAGMLLLFYARDHLRNTSPKVSN